MYERDQEAMAEIVVGTIKSALAPLIARIAALESRPVIHGRDGLPGVTGPMGPAGEKGAPGERGERGEPGKDALPVDTDAIVQAVVKQIPTPTNGRDGKDADTALIEALKAQIAGLQADVADLTTKAAQPPMVADLVRFEMAKANAEIRMPKDGRDGENGKDGTSVTVDDVAPLIRSEVAKAVSAFPTPKDGERGQDGTNGRDGTSITVEDVAPLIQSEIAKAIAVIPVPKDGTNGRDGIDGKDGTGVTVEDVAPLIQAEVAKAVSAIPVPKDGRDGADGVGVAGAVIGRDGDLILTLSDGTVKSLGLVVGRDGQRGEKGEPGANGKDGVDGLGFEDLAVVLEDERTFVITAAKGERVKEIGRFTLPVLIYRDVYKPGQKYEPGDVVTWGNQSYVCKEATTIKPGEGPAWRLMVRKGGDGKAGPPGPKGDRGERGEPGPLAKVY